MPELREQLQNLFGLDEFRPRQREVIEEVLRARDCLCVMPTGAGKSLCYQLPAAMLGGLTVVISPLISLMEDQVQQLTESGIPALLLNSSLNMSEQRNVIAQLHQGFTGLLYVAPERCFAGNFQSTLEQLRPKLLAVDEAHCISQWGHEFRPSMQGLARSDSGSAPRPPSPRPRPPLLMFAAISFNALGWSIRALSSRGLIARIWHTNPAGS